MKINQKILIVDDSLTNILILEELLHGYDVRSAQSGDQALKIAPEFNPDVVLLDIMMPIIDGYEVCRRLRENRNIKRAKIVMVSAKTKISERLKAYEVGADDYITKPFDAYELLAKVKVYLRLKTIEEVDTLKTELLKHLCRGAGSPLTCIVQPLKSLLDSNTDIPWQYKQKIAMSYSGAVSLQELFEKAILLSSIKSGSLKLNLELADLVTITHKIILELEPKVKAKKLGIHLVLPEQAIVRIDIPEITRVIENVLDNAIRFSPISNKVIVEISEANNHFYLSILDQGKGMDAEAVSESLHELLNLAEDPSGVIQWHGLNLSLAQSVISMHKGRIEVDTIKGRGTNMIIVLPSATFVDRTNDQTSTVIIDSRHH